MAVGTRGQPVRIVRTAGNAALIMAEIAREQGFFSAFGVEPEFINVADGAKTIAALTAGEADLCGGGGGCSTVFPAIERGAAVRLVGGSLASPVTALLTRRTDIRSAHDLVGRTVGTGAPGALFHQLTVALLLKKGVDPARVQFVNIGSGPEVFKAIVEGRVDAGPAEVDYYSDRQRYGLRALPDGLFWDELPEFTNQAIYASEAAMTERRELLVATLAAFATLFRFIATGDSEDFWVRARGKVLGTGDPDAARTQWRFFRHPGRLATSLELSPESLAYVQGLNVTLGLQKKVLPFEAVADLSLAQAAVAKLA